MSEKALATILAFAVIGCVAYPTQPPQSDVSTLYSAWKVAFNENTVESYDQFIDRFHNRNPDYAQFEIYRKFVAGARDRKREAEDWRAAQSNIKLLDEHLESYPESRRIDKTRKMIDELSVLSPEEMGQIVADGTVGFSGDETLHSRWLKQLYDAGYHTKCDHSDARVQLVYEYKSKLIARAYQFPGFSEPVSGTTGALGSFVFHLYVGGEPVYAFHGTEQRNPPYSIKALPKPESVDRVGERNAREIMVKLTAPVRELIDEMANSRRKMLLANLDTIDNDDRQVLKDLTHKTILASNSVTELCRWGTILTMNQGRFIFRGKQINITNTTRNSLLQVCDGRWRGVPYSDLWSPLLEESHYDRLNGKMLIVEPFKGCAQN